MAYGSAEVLNATAQEIEGQQRGGDRVNPCDDGEPRKSWSLQSDDKTH